MDQVTQTTLALIRQHKEWAALIVFLLAFCESFAFVSLIVPATAVLLGVGGLIAVSGLHFWPNWLAAAAGACAGDWLAYDLTLRFKDDILRIRPFASHPKLVARGMQFFSKWGIAAVFVGRFFGPLRAIVPIAAGLNAMPWWAFQIANVASAALWAAAVLAPGFLGKLWVMG